MNTYNRTDLKHTILDTDELRYCEIYKITNLVNGKIYIGQAVSHILNHKKYRPYGMEGRFRCHISEAFSSKDKQCHYLNNSIRKHGADNFKVELICNCKITDADEIEIAEILNNNSIFPTGYNLTKGGSTHNHTEESKKRVSIGVMNYFKDKKLQRFKDIDIDDIDIDNIDRYIKPLNRNKIQYGWYVFIKGIKADFGGVHININDSNKMAKDFIEILISQKRQNTLLLETP